MRKKLATAIYILAFVGLLCAPIGARASYVQSGHTNSTSTQSEVCSPNSGSGSVTTGNTIVMAVAANFGFGTFGISSTRVTTWTLDQNIGSGNVLFYHGTATSSGVETITVTNSVGPSGMASVCGEYTTTTLDVTA